MFASSSGGEEELLEFEKAVEIKKPKSTTIVTSRNRITGIGESDEDDYIRITQTVHQVSE